MCCLTKKFQHVCNMLVLPADITHGTCCLKFNTQHVLFCFSTLRLLVQNSMRRVLSPTFKQHRPCVETTSHQDNAHYMCHKQHWCAESTSSHVHWSVICPRCVKTTHEMRYKCCFNTCSSKQHAMGTLTWVISTWLFLQYMCN